jgi:hypothetical protein
MATAASFTLAPRKQQNQSPIFLFSSIQKEYQLMANLTRFKLNYSNHGDTDPHTKQNTVYVAGDVFDSPHDLLKENTLAAKPKFELAGPKAKLKYVGAPGYVKTEATKSVEESSPASNPSLGGTFSAMTVEELKRFAADEEIDLGKAKTKEQILEVIQQATSAKE